MNIDVVTIAHNEEKMIKYFIEHYLPMARTIYVLDHESTDNTSKVAKSYGNKVKVIPVQFKSNVFNVYLAGKIKQQFSKQLDADFVIACDTDEMLFPRDPVQILTECIKNKITVPLTEGYHMLSESFDFSSNIYEIQRAYRDPHFDKKIIFSPKIDIEWVVGQHFTIPHLCGNGYKESNLPLFQLRHYKYINMDYVISRNKVVGSRLDKEEAKMGIGYHHLLPEKQQRDYFQEMMNESIILS